MFKDLLIDEWKYEIIDAIKSNTEETFKKEVLRMFKDGLRDAFMALYEDAI